MNPRARRIRRQRRKDRLRDAVAAQYELNAWLREAREVERAQARREEIARLKAARTDPNHALRVASQIQTGGALFAQMTRALPKV
jgi:hypothetical protein